MYPKHPSFSRLVQLVLILNSQLIFTKMLSEEDEESNHPNSAEGRITDETFEKLQSADNSTIANLQGIENSTLPEIMKFELQEIATVLERIPTCPPGTDLNADNKCQKVYQFNNPEQDNSSETKSEAIDENNFSSESDEFNDCHAFHSGSPELMFLLVIIYTVSYLVPV